MLLARIKQVNGAFVAAVVGEPFHGVKSEKNHTRNMKNVVSQHDNLWCVLFVDRW